MTDATLTIKEPPRWKLWRYLRYGYLAYQIIVAHQAKCVTAHEETTTAIRNVDRKVDEVLTAVRAFTEIQPELSTTVTRQRDRKVLWRYIGIAGKSIAWSVTTGAAMVAIGLWLVPAIRTWIGM